MKDRIIELENGTMLYVLERETYQNKNYILGLKCDLKNDAIDTDNMLVLEVYTENNELIYSGKTDNEGKITLDRLPIGKYYFIEKVIDN